MRSRRCAPNPAPCRLCCIRAREVASQASWRRSPRSRRAAETITSRSAQLEHPVAGAHDVDRIALREVGEQRRGEHHVAQKRGLDDENGAHAARSVHLKNREKRLLRNLDRPHLLHSLFSFLLLLEQLALSRDVAAVALGENVLA